MAALFIMNKKWKHLKCPASEEWEIKMEYIRVMK
jgi:hypothetical protein